MYARTSFRGAKREKLDKFWIGHGGQIKKKRVFRVYFHT